MNPLRTAALASLALLAASATYTPAHARQQACSDDPGAIAAQLGKDYSEVPVVTGIDQSGNLLVVYSAPDGKTWTVTLTSPTSGSTCIVSAGQSLSIDLSRLPSS